jgi:hypothetical protein
MKMRDWDYVTERRRLPKWKELREAKEEYRHDFKVALDKRKR